MQDPGFWTPVLTDTVNPRNCLSLLVEIPKFLDDHHMVRRNEIQPSTTKSGSEDQDCWLGKIVKALQRGITVLSVKREMVDDGVDCQMEGLKEPMEIPCLTWEGRENDGLVRYSHFRRAKELRKEKLVKPSEYRSVGKVIHVPFPVVDGPRLHRLFCAHIVIWKVHRKTHKMPFVDDSLDGIPLF